MIAAAMFACSIQMRPRSLRTRVLAIRPSVVHPLLLLLVLTPFLERLLFLALLLHLPSLAGGPASANARARNSAAAAQTTQSDFSLA